jgi:hypothetical protein
VKLKQPSNGWIFQYLYPFMFSISWTSGLWYRTRYRVLKIPRKSTEDIENLNKFLSSDKIRLIYSSSDTRVYRIKTKYSFIPLKFSISKNEFDYSINGPRIIIDDIEKT